MKCEQASTEFQPVTITLESQEEVDVLHSLLGLASGVSTEGFPFKLYTALGLYSRSRAKEYWSGTLMLEV